MSAAETISLPGPGYSPCPRHGGETGALADRLAVARSCPDCTTWGEDS